MASLTTKLYFILLGTQKLNIISSIGIDKYHCVKVKNTNVHNFNIHDAFPLKPSVIFLSYYWTLKIANRGQKLQELEEGLRSELYLLVQNWYVFKQSKFHFAAKNSLLVCVSFVQLFTYFGSWIQISLSFASNRTR